MIVKGLCGGQGEDLSLVEFRSFEYQQSKQVVAGEDIKKDILKAGIRRLERDAGVSRHTLDNILKRERVRRRTLGKIVKQLRAVGEGRGEEMKVKTPALSLQRTEGRGRGTCESMWDERVG